VGIAPHFVHLAVRALSQSGTPAELCEAAGVSARSVADATRSLVTT
jgi:hypothetical protein